MNLTRREWLAGAAAGLSSVALGTQEEEFKPAVISGTPRERGKQYGRTFKNDIRAFLDKEYAKVLKPGANRDQALRYVDGCGKQIRKFSKVATEEIEGIAEGAGLKMEEVLLLQCHEELWYQGLVPPGDHCAALSAAPPDTGDGNTYVGQSYEWWWRCSWLHWKRTDGPSVLAYTYPGILASVGMNSAGIALCATAARDSGKPDVGVPYYVLSAHMLYQDTLQGALEEARRAKQVGWSAIVMGDANGRLVNVEVTSSHGLVVETHEGHLARHQYGSRKMASTHNARTRHMYDLLGRSRGKLGQTALQEILSDAKVAGSPQDLMLFNTTTREAHFKGAASGGGNRWHTFRFREK